MSAGILIVDDALFIRGVLRKMLEKNGYDVVGEASNGQEAIEKYKELKPDLVTMDITMPGMSGMEATKAIKQIDSEAKIIMCSAMGQEVMVMEAIRNGAIDFIIKPFNEARIMETVRRCAAYGSRKKRDKFIQKHFKLELTSDICKI